MQSVSPLCTSSLRRTSRYAWSPSSYKARVSTFSFTYMPAWSDSNCSIYLVVRVARNTEFYAIRQSKESNNLRTIRLTCIFSLLFLVTVADVGLPGLVINLNDPVWLVHNYHIIGKTTANVSVKDPGADSSLKVPKVVMGYDEVIIYMQAWLIVFDFCCDFCSAGSVHVVVACFLSKYLVVRSCTLITMIQYILKEKLFIQICQIFPMMKKFLNSNGHVKLKLLIYGLKKNGYQFNTRPHVIGILIKLVRLCIFINKKGLNSD